MLIALLSLLAFGTPGLCNEPVPADQLPEIQISADGGIVKVRMENVTITGSQVRIDWKKQQIVVEGPGSLVLPLENITLKGSHVSIDWKKQQIDVQGGDKPASVVTGNSQSTGKTITYYMETNKYTVRDSK